ncbi:MULTISPECIES: hypothetical protein [Synechococcales]|nr:MULTISPECIES: hypothetical protein [Synechococcales]MCP9889482.1 hypothetical protein [Cyanobium sp. Aljojuca 7D2]MCP9941051.1 hypothetical protein [Cyanobium sp. ATX 6E8]
MVSRIAALVLLVALFTGAAGPALAGPVDWHEVATTSEGRQWWDGGSLRRSRSGNVSVLSRFQPAATEDKPRPVSDLYVMEIDCGQALFRDTSINGLPQFGAEWQPAAGDSLIASVIGEVCAAAPEALS